MKLKRIMWIVVSASVLVVLAVVVMNVWQPQPGRPVNGQRITEAVHAFARDCAARGVALPESASLRDLVAKKFLDAKDIEGFGTNEVRIWLTANESRPGKILMEAHLPDSRRVVALADGSVASEAR